METNSANQQVNAQAEVTLSPKDLLAHWQGHRRLTRKVIEAFPEDKLFGYSVAGMRSFGDMTIEIMDMSSDGMNGIITGQWKPIYELDHATGKSPAKTKETVLQQWDQITEQLNKSWQQLSPERFQEVELAFGAYEGKIIDTLFYFIDNEIHHRAQSYVYLRSLGIEPPAFWDRS
ncbi:DinB family protein [Mucilaginibacter aquaedulcis]|uniref:DinB family protein n=1 Tax=Mucilaginibacter aquaedulcis TaxID=1187081 RepID=UPI0025B3F5E9|nr:DinB family protein [Mucilaginibacter aquaedulcis]MDN3548081.1 DinB family protein [Mucilaginibacter aquaedulcis]